MCPKCEFPPLRRTYILFNQEKNTWRMSVSMEGQGDFAKVKAGEVLKSTLEFSIMPDLWSNELARRIF